MYTHEDVLRLLPEQDKQELVLWEGLFENPGYALLTQVLEGNLDGAEAVMENAPSWESYQYYRGARDALQVVLNLQAAIVFKVEEKLKELEVASEEEPLEDFT